MSTIIILLLLVIIAALVSKLIDSRRLESAYHKMQFDYFIGLSEVGRWCASDPVVQSVVDWVRYRAEGEDYKGPKLACNIMELRDRINAQHKTHMSESYNNHMHIWDVPENVSRLEAPSDLTMEVYLEKSSDGDKIVAAFKRLVANEQV
jgi:hypothetical protein